MNPEQGEKRRVECPFTFQGMPQADRLTGGLKGVAWFGRTCDASCALYDVARGLPCVPAAVARLAEALAPRPPTLADTIDRLGDIELARAPIPPATTVYGDPASSGGA